MLCSECLYCKLMLLVDHIILSVPESKLFKTTPSHAAVNHLFTLQPPVPHIFWFFIFYYHIMYHLLNMLKIKCDIMPSISNIWKQLTPILSNLNNFHSLEVVKSRQRDTTSSGWKFRLNNLAVKGLKWLFKLCRCFVSWNTFLTFYISVYYAWIPK